MTTPTIAYDWANDHDPAADYTDTATLDLESGAYDWVTEDRSPLTKAELVAVVMVGAVIAALVVAIGALAALAGIAIGGALS